MTCERCGKGTAVIEYTEVREGRKEKLQICRDCARALGFDEQDLGAALPVDDPGPGPPGPQEPDDLGADDEAAGTQGPEPMWPASPAPDVVEEALEAAAGAAGAEEAGPDEKRLNRRRCADCGMTGARLREQSLFGCPTCYEVFAEALDPLFKRIHGASYHRGRLPGGRRAEAGDPAELDRALRAALKREDYEEAARLRDRLRRAGGPPPPTGETDS